MSNPVRHGTQSRATIHVAPDWQPIIRQLGLDAETVFTHPDIRVWRKLSDRANCTLDAELPEGRKIRLHVKRYAPTRRITTPAEEEFAGHQLLLANAIPTATLVAWGSIADGRSFVIFEDLTGYTPADKLLEAGTDFSILKRATADLAARLHQVGLHHRDLYLCHFLVKPGDDPVDVRLIDPARVRRLPGFITRGRWIVKDLAQFWYSTLKLPITDAQRTAWLLRYCQQRQLPGPALMRQKIDRKVGRIAKHDARLNRLHPARNVSIPW
jgi:hypothetical protein